MDSLIYAPQHKPDIDSIGEAYIFEGVAYSPLKMTFKSSSHSESLELRCNSCEWIATVGDLPEDSGYVQPDMCPECAKNDELGFVRCESPADHTFPKGWSGTDATDGL